MPKAKVIATELENPSISMVSLVKRGSNRTPFRIVKDENGEPVKPSTLMDRLSGVLKGGTTEPGSVLAVVVRKSAEDKYKEQIDALGFEKPLRKADGDQVMYMAEGTNLNVEGSFIALNEDIAIATDRVFKMFESFPMSLDFEENMRGSTFFPGVNWAMEALMDTFWSAMMDAATPAEARGTVETALNAFSAHILEMVGALPQEVFKMEHATLSGGALGGVSKADHEDGDMKNGQMKEAVPGDLDGLEEAPKGAPRQDTSVSKEEAANAGASNQPAEGEPAATTAGGKDPEGKTPVAKEGDGNPGDGGKPEGEPACVEGTDDDLRALVAKMATGMTNMAEAVSKMDERLQKTEEGVQEASTVAKTAQEASGRVVNLQSAGGDLDMALSSLGGTGKSTVQKSGEGVRKSEEDIWDGTMTAFDGLGGSR